MSMTITWKPDAVSDLQEKKRLLGPIKFNGDMHKEAKSSGPWFGAWFKAQMGPGKLTAHEYFYYGLHKKNDPEAAQRYVGKQVQNKLHLKCNQRTWFSLCHDKYSFGQFLKGGGLPHPEIKAVFRKMGAGGFVISMDDRASVKTRLREVLEVPGFIKPIEGMFSIGAFAVDSVDDENLCLSDGRLIRMDDLLDYMEKVDDSGFLIQNLLSGDESLAELQSSALPTVRVMVLLGKTPAIHSATLKVPTGGHMADNLWREGNGVVAVDTETGQLHDQIVTLPGSLQTRTEVNNESLKPRIGQIQNWSEIVSIVKDAAARVPGIRTQGWDVALTSDGPVLIELNFGGDVNLFQLAHGRGLLDEQYCTHLRDCGYRKKLPA